MKRVRIDSVALRDHIDGSVDEYFDTDLGPKIAEAARRYVPKRTHKLEESIGHEVVDHTLVVYAGNTEEGVDYAAYVELGHRVYHPSTGEVGPKVVPPQPYLRPALYQDHSS